MGDGCIFNHTLYSNGETPNGAWTLDKQKLTIRTPDKKAPGGAWVDTYTLRDDGTTADILNQNADKFTGTRIDE